MGKRWIRTLSVGLTSVLLSGCWWQQVGFDAGHTRYNPAENTLTTANVGTLAEDWSVTLVGPPSEAVMRDGKVFVVAGNAGTSDVEAYSFDAATGGAVWQTNLVSLPQFSSFFVVRQMTFARDELWTGYTALDLLNATGETASTVRLDPTTGAVIDTESDSAPWVPIVDAGDQLVEISGSVTANPPLIWLTVRDEATLFTDWGLSLPTGTSLSAPVTANDQLFFAIGTTLGAYSLSGCGPQCAPTWTQTVAQAPTVVAPAGSDAVFAVAGSDVMAFDQATGQLRWQAALGGTSRGLAVAGDTVYVSAGTSVLAYAAAGCGQALCPPLWSSDLGSAASGQPAVAGGVVYVGTQDRVIAFDAAGCGSATCSSIGVVAVGAPVSALSIDGGRLFVTSGNTLKAFTPSG